jgi:hypothetical protein
VNDVKEICDLVLDAPAPPLRGSTEAFEIARRETRRRDRLRAAGYGIAAVAAATAAAVLAAPGATPVHQREPITAAVGTQAAERPAPRVPSAQAADAHGREVARVLAAAVPAGYAVNVVDLSPGTDSPASTWYLRPVPGGYVSGTRLVVSAGGGEGELVALITADGNEPPAGDVCAADVSSRFARDHSTGDFTCEAVTVDGVQVRVVTERLPDVGEVVTATMFLRGGFVMVVSQQGVRPYEPDGQVPPDARDRGTPTGQERKPALNTPMLTWQQVAAIAANPALLP